MWLVKWNELSAEVRQNGPERSLVRERNQHHLPQTGEPQWTSTI
jgi:hypothetical protein